MNESEDSFLKNKVILIKTIRLVGGFFVLIGVALFLFEHVVTSAIIFALIGVFQILAAPRVLEWIIQVRNRDIK